MYRDKENEDFSLSNLKAKAGRGSFEDDAKLADELLELLELLGELFAGAFSSQALLSAPISWTSMLRLEARGCHFFFLLDRVSFLFTFPWKQLTKTGRVVFDCFPPRDLLMDVFKSKLSTSASPLAIGDSHKI